MFCFKLRLICISQVLDERLFLVLSFALEQGEAARHRQLLPLRPPRVVTGQQLHVLIDPLPAQRHHAPRIQISVVPLPHYYSQVDALGVNELD